ncbi:MAG: glycerol-3-phosphate dehydrogenase [Porticoccaceae bacterium]|nr:glycerol-3-phosphate dehydrogenase [Porticoccaceae bacterium]
MEDTARFDVDVAIIGGGVAGLWTLNRLCRAGYNAVLLESRALGSGQTMASQGMIHGGMKYTLSGALTGASEAIADMPDHWRRCLRGEGDVDLRRAEILSDHFYMWSTASITSRLGGFLASKTLRGRVDKVSRRDLPDLLKHPGFKGTVYRLADVVMDTPSVVRALAENMSGRIFKIDWPSVSLNTDSEGHTRLQYQDSQYPFTLAARAWVFSAGRGNQDLLDAVGATRPTMQLRPLKQVMVRHNLPYSFFGHCLGAETTPRLTISSHPMGNGSQVWYLGGSLAEKGVDQDDETLIGRARGELTALMPWLDLKTADWAVLPVERAEPRQQNLSRPDNAFADWVCREEGATDCIVAWPTKLTLSPNLAQIVMARLDERNIRPGGGPAPAIQLPAPEVAPTPWETAFA